MKYAGTVPNAVEKLTSVGTIGTQTNRKTKQNIKIFGNLCYCTDANNPFGEPSLVAMATYSITIGTNSPLYDAHKSVVTNEKKLSKIRFNNKI